VRIALPCISTRLCPDKSPSETHFAPSETHFAPSETHFAPREDRKPADSDSRGSNRPARSPKNDLPTEEPAGTKCSRTPYGGAVQEGIGPQFSFRVFPARSDKRDTGCNPPSGRIKKRRTRGQDALEPSRFLLLQVSQMGLQKASRPCPDCGNETWKALSGDAAAEPDAEG
jgi:hypothetical protein